MSAPEPSPPADRTAAVVVVGPIPPPRHGAAVVTDRMMNRLEGVGVNVVVVNTAATSESAIGYHLARVRAHLRACRVLLAQRLSRPSVYIAGAGGAGLWYQVGVVALARRLGLRVIHHHHSYAYISRPSLAMRALVKAGAGSLTHVTLSDDMAHGLQDLYGIDESVVCSNAVFVGAPTAPGTAVAHAPLSLGHFGNLSIEKGLALALATFRELVRRQVPVRLSLAGPVAGAQELALIHEAQSEFGDLVAWEGPLDRPEVDEFMNGLDLLLFPSTYVNEAQPLVVLEAARLGVPAMAIDHGSLSSVVADRSMLARSASTYVAETADRAEYLAAGNALAALRSKTLSMFEEQHASSSRRIERLLESMVGEDES